MSASEFGLRVLATTLGFAPLVWVLARRIGEILDRIGELEGDGETLEALRERVCDTQDGVDALHGKLATVIAALPKSRAKRTPKPRPEGDAAPQ